MIPARGIAKLAQSPWLALAFRLYLAGLFIYASMHKISYAGEFANNTASYQILPYWLVNLTAATLPWIELICGTLLAAGVRVKSSALCVAAMLLVFSLAIALNLIRGNPVGCGCFQSVGDPISWKTFFRDIILLCMSLHVFFFDKHLQLERKILLPLKDLRT